MTSLLLALALSTAPLAPVVPLAIGDFCPRGFEVLKGDACLAKPARFEPGRLILYFHGLLPADRKSPAELELLGRLGTARGFAVLAMRGSDGQCPLGRAGQYRCWPSDKAHVPWMGETIERLVPLLRQTARALDTKSLGSPLVAGFSNGGYFTTLLLSDTWFDARGWAILHAGGLTGQAFELGRKSPVLLVAATGDLEQMPGMRALSTQLRDQGWKVAERLRDGVHEVREDDVEAVLDFFQTLER